MLYRLRLQYRFIHSSVVSRVCLCVSECVRLRIRAWVLAGCTTWRRCVLVHHFKKSFLVSVENSATGSILLCETSKENHLRNILLDLNKAEREKGGSVKKTMFRTCLKGETAVV